MAHFDHLIVGQGLAGTALAWMLIDRGLSVGIIDRADAVTSSKIAAGLMTPITGQRLVKQDRWEMLRGTATAFYRRIEGVTQSRFLIERGMVRPFADGREKEIYGKREQREFAGLVRAPTPDLDPRCFNYSLGSFEMPTALHLLCGPYLKASRRHFEGQDCFFESDIDRNGVVEAAANGIAIPKLNVTAGGMTYCGGYADRFNPALAGHWQAAQGEILTVHIPDLAESRIVNRGVWLAPVGDGLFRVGSTHEWDVLDGIPTEAKRVEIIRRLQLF